MDLEVARKALSKRGASSTKRVAFLVVAGLLVVVGIGMRASQYFGQPAEEENAPAAVAAPTPSTDATPAGETTEPVPAPAVEKTAPVPKTPLPKTPLPKTPLPKAPPAAQEAASPPSEPAPQASEPTEQAAQPEPQGPDAGMILVSRKPVEVLASPSSSAPAMYGFPAGRPFRVIGREGGFAQIQDLKSGASGWIDEAALAPPPPRAPAVSAPSQTKPAAVSRKPATAAADPKPKTTKKGGQATADAEPEAEPDPVQTRKQPGLFGQGGLFGGIFGGGN
jgi:hypothetical protein